MPTVACSPQRLHYNPTIAHFPAKSRKAATFSDRLNGILPRFRGASRAFSGTEKALSDTTDATPDGPGSKASGAWRPPSGGPLSTPLSWFIP